MKTFCRFALAVAFAIAVSLCLGGVSRADWHLGLGLGYARSPQPVVLVPVTALPPVAVTAAPTITMTEVHVLPAVAPIYLAPLPVAAPVLTVPVLACETAYYLPAPTYRRSRSLYLHLDAAR